MAALLKPQILRTLLLLYSVSLLVSMAGMELFGWLAWFLGLLAAYQKGVLFPRQFRSLDYALGGLFVTILVGLVLNTPPPINWEEVLGSTRWIILFWGLRGAMIVAVNDDWVEKFLKVWAWITLVIGVYAIFQHLFGIDVIRWDQEDVKPMDDWPWGVGKIYRSVGTLGSPMTYGHSVAMVGFVLLGTWIGARGFINRVKVSIANLGVSSRLLGVAAFFAGVGLFCSYTRGAWLATAGGLIVMGAMISRRVLAGVVISMALVVFGAMQLHPSFGRRLFSIVDKNTHSFGDRQTIWAANVQMFRDYPIFGIGYGENERLIGDYYNKLGIVEGQLGHAHNTLLQFLAGTGVVGTLLYLFFILFIGVLTWREYQGAEKPLYRGLLLGVLTAQIVLQLGGLTECNFKDAEVNHLYLFLAALISSVSANRRAV